jgi:hypothetical protein
MTTTINAIRKATATTLDALSLSYQAYGTRSLSRARYTSWDAMAASEIDRHYWIGWIIQAQPMYIGSPDEVDYSGELGIEIGHLRSGDEWDMLDRMETDLHEIVNRLEDKSSYPSGVSLLRLTGQSHRDVTVAGSVFTVTTLRFKIVYAMAL